MDPQNLLESYLQAGSLLAYPLVFAGGMLTSLTPCTYPLIPVTVAYIGSRSAGTTRQGFLLSVTYAAGIAVVYALLGGIAAFSGRIFGLVSAHPLTQLAVGAMLLVMTLSMLEIIALPLPAFQKGPGKEQRGGIAGAFSFGLCSGLVIGPCTAPVMGALLLFVASRQSVVYGMSLLFVFACGLCTILICVGSLAGLAARLPRSGPWLVVVKRGMAILMGCSGAYFLYQACSIYF